MRRKWKGRRRVVGPVGVGVRRMARRVAAGVVARRLVEAAVVRESPGPRQAAGEAVARRRERRRPARLAAKTAARRPVRLR